jgi:hypothetical protein
MAFFAYEEMAFLSLSCRISVAWFSASLAGPLLHLT